MTPRDHEALVDVARKRDHRKLGKELGLFATSSLVGAGLVFWMPRGAVVRGILEAFLRNELTRRGYQPVYTPHIGKVELFQAGGLDLDDTISPFPPMRLLDEVARLLVEGLGDARLDDGTQKILLARAGIPETMPVTTRVAGGHPRPSLVEDYWSLDTAGRIRYVEQYGESEEYLLKPINCLHHIQVYAAQPRSYRDLPFRVAEFGTVYRDEPTGALSGLTRVRGSTRDDAHLFCTVDQVGDEVRATIELTMLILKSLGFNDYRFRLSTHDPVDARSAEGSGATWRRVEGEIRRVLGAMCLTCDEAPGGAASHGPKVDCVVRDGNGRPWQVGTVRLDDLLPERFGIEYRGADNRPHRPLLIHTAWFGSMERFLGLLIEHFAGAFPPWLAPEQVRVLPISDKFAGYGRHVLRELHAAGLRATCDLRPEKLGARIRDAQMEKVPAMLIVGGKEAEHQAVSYRDRIDGDRGAMPLSRAVVELKAESDARTVRQVEPPANEKPVDGHGEKPRE